MYFEEPWFIDLNFRLNSFHNIITTMTSASVQSDNVDDFEEGEILDDDDDIPLPVQDVDKSTSPNNSNLSNSEKSIQSDVSLRSGSSRRPRCMSRGREPSPDQNDRESKGRNSRFDRKRSRTSRKTDYPPERRPYRTRPNDFRNERHLNNMRDRAKGCISYEDRLKDLQQRTERLRSHSQTPERKPPLTKKSSSTTGNKNSYSSRTKTPSPPRIKKNSASPTRSKNSTNSIRTKHTTGPAHSKNGSSPSRPRNSPTPRSSPAKTILPTKPAQRTNFGSSLLKRLVGSGSVDIKLLEDNLLEQNMCTNSNLSESCKSPLKEEIPLPDNVNESVTTSPLVNNEPFPVEAQVIIETENSATKNKQNVYINENTSDSSAYRMELDTDLLELRMAALKTAMVKNHNKRTSKGYVPKKIVNQVDDLFIDSFMDIDSLINSDPIDDLEGALSPREKILNDELGNIYSDHSDMSLESDDDAPQKNIATSDAKGDISLLGDAEVSGAKGDNIPSLKRQHSAEYPDVSKKLKLVDESQENYLDLKHNIEFDLNEEELQLRDLALRSFFGRSKKSPTMIENDSDEVTSQPEIFVSSPFEDIEVESKMVETDGKSPRKRTDSDNWEELDEDILRAHLLKTLSANLPERSYPDEDDLIETKSSQNVIKPLSSLFPKKEPDPELDKQCKLWSESMVPKLVISLVSDSESEPESSSVDFVKSLDLLLQEAKEKSEKPNSKEELKPKVKKKTVLPKQPLKKPLLKKGLSATPVAVRHLPIQQQEEYRRLKIKLEKLKLNKTKGSTDVSPTTSRTESPVPPSIPQTKQDDTPSSKTSTNLLPSQKQITVTSKTKTKIINRVEPVLKKTNIPIVDAKPEKVDTTVKSKLLIPSNFGTKHATPAVNMKKNLFLSNKPGTNIKSNVSLDLSNISRGFTKLVNQKNNFNQFTSKSLLVSPKDKSVQSKTNVKTVSKQNILSKLDKKENLLSKDELPDTINNPVPTNDNKLLKSPEGKLMIEPNVEIPLKEAVVQKEKEKSVIINKKTLLPCADRSNRVSSSMETKENEGNSDKENEVIKNKDKSVLVGQGESEQEISERSDIECKVSDWDISKKLRVAESRYDETLSLVARLEKELERAKKMLTERAHTVAVLKQLSIESLIDVATLSVNTPDDESTSEKAVETTSQTVVDSENTEE